MLGVYGPTFGYAALIILVLVPLALIAKLRGGLPTIAALVAILLVGYGAIAGRLMMSVLSALRKGVYAAGEITSVSAMNSRMRVIVDGREMDVQLRGRVYRPGQRLNVMVDTARQSVLLVLGSDTT